MPKEVKITCDNCGADLTSTGNCVDWRIALLNEEIMSWGGFVTALQILPNLKQDRYFCRSECLKAWVNERYV